MDNPDLSIIVPMFNEEEVLETFFSRINPVLDQANCSYEIICINDGSRDRTVEIVKEKAEKDERIKMISLSRNFGKEMAMTAGLDYASGRAVIPIDADLQDPPELIIDFIDKWREGFDVVYGIRDNRETDTLTKKMTAGWFYRVFNQISEIPIPYNTGDYRLMDRRVVEAIKGLPERRRFMKGVFAWVGFKQVGIAFTRELRAEGKSKFTFWKLWNFAIEGITSFSIVPLKVWTYIGFVVSAVSFLYALLIILRTIVLGVDVPGYSSVMVAILFFGGVQLISLGVMGEYIGRIHEEVKQRPHYLVGEAIGFGERDTRESAKQERSG